MEKGFTLQNVVLITEEQWNNSHWIIKHLAKNSKQLKRLMVCILKLDIEEVHPLVVLLHKNHIDSAVGFMDWLTAFVQRESVNKSSKEYVLQLTASTVHICVALELLFITV